MSALFMLAFIITLFLLLLILFFMKNSKKSLTVNEVNNNIFKHQFIEIEEDFKIGKISEQEFYIMKNELSKRVLKYSSNIKSDKKYDNKVLNRIIKIIFIPLIILLSTIFYYYNGQPELPDLPLSDRKENNVPNIFYQQALKDIDKKISNFGENLELYILKANTLTALNKYEQSVTIWKYIIDSFEEELNASIYLSYGEAIIQKLFNQENKILITREAKDIFEKASKLSSIETEVGALTRFYLGLHDYQNGKTLQAQLKWEEILISAPVNAPWKEQIELQVTQISRDENNNKNKQILSMVSQLSERLYASNSQNIIQWNKLGRSLIVLEKYSQAVKAYQKAYDLEPKNIDAIKGLAESLLLNHEKDKPVQDNTIQLFENILLKDTNYPLALWVIAEHEILINNFVRAEKLLNRLLIQLSEGSEEYNLVINKLKAFDNK
jgi:cytochrome c-type biogenesis protein CcmI